MIVVWYVVKPEIHPLYSIEYCVFFLSLVIFTVWNPEIFRQVLDTWWKCDNFSENVHRRNIVSFAGSCVLYFTMLQCFVLCVSWFYCTFLRVSGNWINAVYMVEVQISCICLIFCCKSWLLFSHMMLTEFLLLPLNYIIHNLLKVDVACLVILPFSIIQCKHDFCWVCLEPWKKHSTATGGYFRCNRYEVVKKVEEHQDMLKSEVLSSETFLLLFKYALLV